MPSPYMDTDGDRIVKSLSRDIKRPYIRAPLGIPFGTPGVEVADPYFGGEGSTRTGCISCGAYPGQQRSSRACTVSSSILGKRRRLSARRSAVRVHGGGDLWAWLGDAASRVAPVT
jgi:hypothetical protein